jgi:hypothetical protein
MKSFAANRRGWVWLVLAWLALADAGWAGDLKLGVQLIWGTNEAKPPGKDMPELAAETREKIARHLRWKNYFVVKRVFAEPGGKEARRLDLSKHCAVELKDLGGQIEVRVFTLKEGAEPKLVTEKKVEVSELKKGHMIAIGGDSKDNWDDAWLLIIQLAPPGTETSTTR